LFEIGSSAFGIVLALITVKVIKDYAAAEVLFAKIDEREEAAPTIDTTLENESKALETDLRENDQE
jgi:hypothetical protein